MPATKVLCAECADKKKRMERNPRVKVLSCKPIPGNSQFCTLEYETTYGAAPPAGGVKKKK